MAQVTPDLPLDRNDGIFQQADLDVAFDAFWMKHVEDLIPQSASDQARNYIKVCSYLGWRGGVLWAGVQQARFMANEFMSTMQAAMAQAAEDFGNG